ncbi:DJ-1/PfpI family protein [Vibrio sp. SCSIO 43136]|uniref:DJ-1/PfpI family protein n=1 Tax=Vibrio sp. SCSIO 43136 TaxID=2819101 RepID=UPI002074ECC4|nr:DJ-1/PfpI family protein [Vibrio sp. SCSIO 43136]USD68159.1 DJ-1/PfpI family protein [Vibrio sp. SCSIO 43136]
MNIGIFVYDNAEPIDFSGPYEVFATANKHASAYETQFTPYLISQNGDPVSGRHGFQVLPHRSFYNHPPLDVLIIPGGVYSQELRKPEVIEWLQAQAKEVSILASVSNGAFLLAAAGLLEGRRVTTHWQQQEQLAVMFPKLSVVKNVRWVEDGEVMTSAGSAGIDMSLQLVSRLTQNGLAKVTAQIIDVTWRDEHVVAY